MEKGSQDRNLHGRHRFSDIREPLICHFGLYKAKTSCLWKGTGQEAERCLYGCSQRSFGKIILSKLLKSVEKGLVVLRRLISWNLNEIFALGTRFNIEHELELMTLKISCLVLYGCEVLQESRFIRVLHDAHVHMKLIVNYCNTNHTEANFGTSHQVFGVLCHGDLFSELVIAIQTHTCDTFQHLEGGVGKSNSGRQPQTQANCWLSVPAWVRVMALMNDQNTAISEQQTTHTLHVFLARAMCGEFQHFRIVSSIFCH